jgi:hypothetical protein
LPEGSDETCSGLVGVDVPIPTLVWAEEKITAQESVNRKISLIRNTKSSCSEYGHNEIKCIKAEGEQ